MFDVRLKLVGLETKSDIAYFIKTDFCVRVKAIKHIKTSNKTKHLDAYKKLTNCITSYINVMYDLAKEVELISNNQVTKDLI